MSTAFISFFYVYIRFVYTLVIPIPINGSNIQYRFIFFAS